VQWGHIYSRKQRLKQQRQVLGDRVRLFALDMTPMASALLFWLATGLFKGSASGAPTTLGTFVAFQHGLRHISFGRDGTR